MVLSTQRESAATVTGNLAAPAYDALQPGELAQLTADLEPIAAAMNAAYDTET